MANTYNTGNAIGSADPRDAYDNASNFDEFSNSASQGFTDRRGVSRKTITGATAGYAAYTNRGEWTTATAYNVNDVWRDGAAGAFYLALADYTSGASAAADIAGGNVVVHQPKDWVVSVNTIADLRALEPAFDGQQVELLGHTVAGVGGGEWYYDASDTATADDGWKTIVTTGGKRWKLRETDFSLTSFEQAGSPTPAESAFSAYINTLPKDGIPARKFGLRGNGSNEGAILEAAINSGENIIFEDGRQYGTDRPLTVSGGRQTLRWNNGQLIPVADLGGNHILELAGDFASVVDLGLVNVAGFNSNGVLQSGFKTSIMGGELTGTTAGNVVLQTGLESTLAFAKVKGGTSDNIQVSNSDANILHVYSEQSSGGSGLRASAGSMVAVNLHSFNNNRRGMYLVGANFSQIWGFYGDTNGDNTIEMFDTSLCGLTSCWGFKGGQNFANKSELILSGTSASNKFYDFRASHGASAQQTDFSIRPGSNVNFFYNAYADHAAQTPGKARWYDCTGSLKKYNSSPREDRDYGFISASGSFSFELFFWDIDFDSLSGNIAVVELTVTTRYGDSTADVYKVYLIPRESTTVIPDRVVQHVIGGNHLTFDTLSYSANTLTLGVTNTHSQSGHTTIVGRYIADARNAL